MKNVKNSTKDRLNREIDNVWYEEHYRGLRLKDMDSNGKNLYLKNIKNKK